CRRRSTWTPGTERMRCWASTTSWPERSSTRTPTGTSPARDSASRSSNRCASPGTKRPRRSQGQYPVSRRQPSGRREFSVSPEPTMSSQVRRDSSTWLEAIEQMEDDLAHVMDDAAVKRHLAGSPTADDLAALERPLRTPSGTGPFPEELTARAQALMKAQSAAIERLEGLKRTTGRHLAAMRSVPPHRDDRSVYIDIAG